MNNFIRHTQTENQLIQKRDKRLKKLKYWYPGLEEFQKLVSSVWQTLATEKGKDYKEISIFIRPYDEEKHLNGLSHCFGRYVGTREKAAIIVYMFDVFSFNLGQKDLIAEHLYYILEHELGHHSGTLTHEDIGNKSKV